MPLARTVRPCRHLFTGGHQCGSPALRGEELCFYHHSTRRPLKTQALHGRGTAAVLPEPLDLHAVQRGLAELLRLTAAELIALPLAAQLHRQLASASQNLARIERSEARADARAEARADARAEALHLDRSPVTDYTNHPTLGTIAPAPEVQPEVQTDAQTTQTQPQSNEDFETSTETLAEPHNEAGCPTFATVSPSLRWASATETAGCPTFATASSSLRWDSSETPLPDPIARFTLPPEPEFLESKAKLAASELAYADAYNKLAQGIHNRAKAREDLHHAFFPLDTLVREQDQEDLEHDPQVAWRVDQLHSQQEKTAA